jgi:hypothetical protein
MSQSYQHPSQNRVRVLLAALVAVIFLLVGASQVIARGGSGSGGGGGSDDGGGNGGGGGGNGGGGGGNGGGGNGSLVLRINPAIGAPGGTVAIVLRTYAPRPVRQGQTVVRVVRRPRPAKALGLTLEELTQPVRPLTFLSAVVYSQRNDSTSQGSLTGQPDSQTARVQFTSPSGTINASDGPLAVFRFRLDPSVAPGQTFDLSLDPALTGLTDPSGQPITLQPRGATLTVRAPNAPYLVEADGDKVGPGEVAELGVNTFEPFLVSGGKITVTWNPALAGGPPTVRLDPRYGKSTFTIDTSRPGRLVVDFRSPDSSFNNVPGTIVSIAMPIKASASIGATSPFNLDPAGTWLLNRRGRKMPIRMENGVIQIE